MAAWLMLTKEERQHGGNLGYDDNVSEYYSWNSTVPKHKEPREGDKIVLWDSDVLLGASTIQAIEFGSGRVLRMRCPKCNTTKIKQRSKNTRRQKYKCQVSGRCGAEFNEPIVEKIDVSTFKSFHGQGWLSLPGEIDGATLRSLTTQPKSQHSIRPLDWDKFLQALNPNARRGLAAFDDPMDSPSGHRSTRTRVRIGQAKFRRKLFDQFGSNCAFSGECHPDSLDAAHLYSYAELGEHQSHGGLLIRKDLHRLFDLGLIVISPDTLCIKLSEELVKCKQYAELDGVPLKVNVHAKAKSWLEKHFKHHSA